MAKILKLVWPQKERRLGTSLPVLMTSIEQMPAQGSNADMSEIFIVIKANWGSSRAKHSCSNFIFQSIWSSLEGLNPSILSEMLALPPRAKDNANRETKW